MHIVCCFCMLYVHIHNNIICEQMQKTLHKFHVLSILILLQQLHQSPPTIRITKKKNNKYKSIKNSMMMKFNAEQQQQCSSSLFLFLFLFISLFCNRNFLFTFRGWNLWALKCAQKIKRRSKQNILIKYSLIKYINMKQEYFM